MGNLTPCDNRPIIIVGAGITGIVMAEQISNKLNKKIIIVEKRNHIGGNCFDLYSKDGLLYHKYGPHIFHTNNKSVWEYLSKFTYWNYIEIKVKAFVEEKLISIPVNINTIKDLYNMSLTEDEMFEYFQKFKKNNINNSEELLISKVGIDIYNKIYKNYIKKQWDKETKDLDQRVISRLPIRFNSDERYFTDKYQGLPLNGYTHMFKNMLKNPNIEIILNKDYKTILKDIDYCHLVYTGPIDYFYDYKYGKLEYRGLKFRVKTYKDNGFFLNNAIISYPNNYKYTRSVEYKQLTGQANEHTIVVYEYPAWNNLEYYPVLTEKNKLLLVKYTKEEKKDNVTFVGRLAEYEYYNMDKAVERALEVSSILISEYK